MIPFVLVWLRAAGLAGQATALGGALVALVVLGRGREPGAVRAVDRTLRITTLGALVAGVAQIGVLAALGWELADDAGWPIADLLSSTVGLTGLTRVVVACLAAAAALMLRRAPGSGTLGGLLLAATFLLTLTGALAGHAVGRLEGQLWLWSVSALHQAAAGAWLGGLVCAAVLAARPQGDDSGQWLHRFSALAATAVVVLASTGMTLSLAYVGAPDALVTTSYGAMVLSKIVLFIALLAMGVLNHRVVHGRIRLVPRPARVAVSGVSPLALRRRLEVEAGLGLVALAMAASLSSAPPATDVTTGRATLEEVRRIFTPQWPRWQAPSATELAAASNLGDPMAPRMPENRQWSEFGHHVAGVFVVGMGLLAMLERTGKAPWARHWPLLIVGLTGFITWSMDPEGWQTGTVGFWEQLRDPEVLQHRMLLLLTALFAWSEWRVRSGHHPTSRLRFVFPLAGILGGVLLLAHVHEVNDAKTGLFMELTHLPMGLVALLIGWARWLELRSGLAPEGWSGRLWAPALVVFGLLLVLYREA